MKKGNTTIVPIDDKTLYNKDKKVNGLMKQLSSYTSVQGVSWSSNFQFSSLKSMTRVPGYNLGFILVSLSMTDKWAYF